MTSINFNGYRIKTSFFDSFLDSILFLWQGENGRVRAIPRNIYQFESLYFFIAIICTFGFVGWLISHVPFIWPEGVGALVAITAIAVNYKPYQDCTRAIILLGVSTYLLQHHVAFGLTIFGYHIEKYLCYVAIAASIFALWRRLFNWLCWSQIDRICKKYGVPKYDQKELMDNYEGYNTNYGIKRKTFATYSEAISAQKQNS